MRSVCLVVTAILFSVIAGGSSAAPMLDVAHVGLTTEGNREWVVTAAPDPALFAPTPSGFGGSLSIEFALEVDEGELLGATHNFAQWPFNTPGNNPFTAGVSLGLSTDLAADTLFAALTSVVFTTGDAVEVLRFETLGSGAASVRWGGHTLLPGTAFQYVGSRLAQAGMNFDGLQGSLSVEAVLSGDFDGDGDVDGEDFLTWQRGFGQAQVLREQGDADGDGIVNAGDLAVWQAQFGGSAAARAIPEPTGGLMLAGTSAAAARWVRRRRQ